MNNELKNVHQLLMAQHQALYDKLDSVTDPVLAKTLVTEMQEILHRIDIVQGLLFQRTSAGLRKSVEQVDQSSGMLDKALKEAQSSADYVRGVSKFLSFVDKAVDLAKTLAPGAI